MTAQWACKFVGLQPYELRADVVEADSMTLACNEGYEVTDIIFASYGTPSKDLVKDEKCHASTSEFIFEGMCLKQNACRIPATDRMYVYSFFWVNFTLFV
jgi:hypothetical protein